MSHTGRNGLTAESAGPAATAAEPVELICSEVWGGNREVHTEVKMPGITGFIYSHPCEGARGGDVHYLTTCSAGLISRVCLADVVGHGETVSRVSSWLHRLLRKHMSVRDPRRVLQGLNVQLANEGLAAMTTAACVSFYAPLGELVYCYAGHPPAWCYRRADDEWCSLPLSGGKPERVPESPANAVRNLPLGVQRDTTFERALTILKRGDRLFLYSDGVVETPDANRTQFGRDRLQRCLNEHRHAGLPAVAQAVLDRLFDHAGQRPLTHDDVTMVLLEIGDRPQGSMMLNMVKNQLRKLLTRRRKR